MYLVSIEITASVQEHLSAPNGLNTLCTSDSLHVHRTYVVARPDDLVGRQIIIDVETNGLSSNATLLFEVVGECYI